MLSLSYSDWQAISITLKLAFVTTVILLIISTPLAWWLARSKSLSASIIQTITALPLVLPPTVIGFYCLMLLSPNGFIGQIATTLGMQQLAFSFTGIVIASCFYSLPFVVQPLQNSFQQLNWRAIESAKTLQAPHHAIFTQIIFPQAKSGFITASILGFAHTVGEFGVILMVGGSIPGETKVASVQIFEHVESLTFAQAHQLSLLLLAFSFVVLFMVYRFSHRPSLIKLSS